LCPVGWHVPSDDEWTELRDFLGGEDVAGGKMKSTSGWNNSGNGTNESGFTALPGGIRQIGGSFAGAGNSEFWWTSTPYFQADAWSPYVAWHDDIFYFGHNTKGYGFSVRCIQN